MPGIYVRKAKLFDWVQRRENPVLTVPGSYWLCHKNNIYKFIFRYHRTMRNVGQFGFGRELMKVIRRIIKSQPRQGQQFGTSNLLVTYNQTSWTRQDKMFALLKFKERSVAAFSHAFVLTIKILFSFESTEQNAKYMMTFAFSDDSIVQSDEDSSNTHTYKKKNDKENKSLTHLSKNDLSGKNEKCDDVHGEVLESENKSIQLDNNLIASNLQTTNEQSTKQVSNCKDISKVTRSSKISLEASVEHNVSSEINTASKNTAKETKYLKYNTENLKKENINQNASNRTSVLLNGTINDVEENRTIINESEDSNCFEKESIENNCSSSRKTNVKNNKLIKHNKLLNINKYVTEQIPTKYKSTSNINELLKDNSSTVDITNIDSVNLPYQYLIEKDIENAKHKISNANETTNNVTLHNKDKHNSRKHKLEEIDEKHSTNSAELLTDIVKTEELHCSKKRKSDNMQSRSSDITDLVMEGLMFTIRQGRDTVTVIEQKTKLEVDEVLENSEKIETTKGEKCLRNSSLLGLENLITMIELPKQNEVKYKYQDMVIQENILKNQSTNKFLLPADDKIKQQDTKPHLECTQWQSPSNSTSLAGTSFTNNNEKLHTTNKNKYSVYPRTFSKHEHEFIKNEDPEYEDEEEDIVPEALQDKIFQSSVPFEKRIKSETTKNERNPLLVKDILSKVHLKMDCSNNNSPSKSHEMSVKTNANETYECSPNTTYKSIFNNENQHKLNVPIIVSNEIITVDQIPLPLQEILKNKLSVTHTSVSNKKVNKNNDNINKVLPCQEKSIIFNTEFKDQILDCNTSKNTQYLENSQIPMHINNKIQNESPSSLTSEMILENINTSEFNLKLKEEESRKQNIMTDREEPNKMQDITNEFYEDLSYLQNKKNLIEHRHLRSRKSVNMLKDNDETCIEMVKFFHDITRGAKVVVRRMSTESMHSIIEKSSSLPTCMQH